MAQEVAASCYGAALGLKPLYHEEFGADAAGIAAVLRRHVPADVCIKERDGHVYAYREDAVSEVVAGDAEAYPGATLFEKIHRACIEGRNGELLGYGVRTMHEGVPAYVISPDGVAVFGFRSREDLAQERTDMFAAIWSDLFGGEYTRVIRPAPGTPASAPARTPWYFGAYHQLALSIVFSASAQPLLKKGADRVHLVMEAAHAPDWHSPFYFLLDLWAWLGIVAIIASLLSWLHALKTVPLNIAFNLAGIIHVLVPLASWMFLGEFISPLRWSGILLVTLGVVITAKEAVRLEEKL